MEGKGFSNEETGAKPDKIEIPPKIELPNIHDRLAAIIRTISGRPDLKVTTEINPRTMIEMMAKGKDPDQQWFNMPEYDRKTGKELSRYIHIPSKIMERSEDIAMGKAAHEAGHTLITRAGGFVPDEVMQQTGFQSLMSATEERPTDQVVREHSEGAGQMIDEARRDNLVNMKLKLGERRVGYIPKFAQLNNLIVHGPHMDQGALDIHREDVIAAYEKVKLHVEEVEHTLPPAGAPEKAVTDKAKERYKIVWGKVWPEAKKLVEADKETEKLRQMIDQSLRADQRGNHLEVLSDEHKKELAEEISKELAGGKSDLEPKVLPPGKDQLEDLKEEIAEREEKDGPMQNIPVPMDHLSKELIRALQEIYQMLTEKEKKELEEQAKRELEAIEDIMTVIFGAHLADVPPETHAEYRKLLADQLKAIQEEKTEREKITKEMREIEKHQQEIQANKSVYENAYQEIRESEEDLYRRLEEIFNPNIKRTVKLRSSGTRINLPAVFRWEADKGGGAPKPDSKIFETYHLPEKKDYTFTILVDLSLSMRGIKIAETFKAVVLLTEVLNRLGINFQIVGYHDRYMVFKDFEDELDDARRGIIGNMRGIPSVGGSTDTAGAMTEASRTLAEKGGREQFLVVMTDGQPNSAAATHEAVGHVTQETNQKLIGIGLGPKTGFVKEFFPNALPNIAAKQLPELLGNLLENIIRNPEAYAHKGEKKP